MASERGQATIEWTAVVLLVALAFASFLALALPHVDGRSYGGALARAILCAARGGCNASRGVPAAASVLPAHAKRGQVDSIERLVGLATDARGEQVAGGGIGERGDRGRAARDLGVEPSIGA
jgi:hypothetical protein